VQRHAHAQRPGLLPGRALQGALCRQRGRQRIRRVIEGNAAAVPDDLEHPAAMTGHCLLDEVVVAGQRRAHRLGRAFPQARAALDIREQEGDVHSHPL